MPRSSAWFSVMHAFELQILEEHLERDDVPPDAGRSELLVGEPGRVAGKVADREAFDSSRTEPFEEPPQVAIVGHDRVLGQMAFAPQIADEGFAPASGVFGSGHAARFDLFAVGGHGGRLWMLDGVY